MGIIVTCMVSYTAMPAVTTPPGELMYMLICTTAPHPLRVLPCQLECRTYISAKDAGAQRNNLAALFPSACDLLYNHKLT